MSVRRWPPGYGPRIREICFEDNATPAFRQLWESMARQSFRTYQTLLGLPANPVEFIDDYFVSQQIEPEDSDQCHGLWRSRAVGRSVDHASARPIGPYDSATGDQLRTGLQGGLLCPATGRLGLSSCWRKRLLWLRRCNHCAGPNRGRARGQHHHFTVAAVMVII